MLKFRHFTVAVHDLDEAVEGYRTRLGMEPTSERAHNSIGNFDFVPMGYEGETLVHLLTPSSEDSPIYRLMQDRVNPLNPNGEGMYLLQFEAKDTEALAKRVEENGGRVNRAPNSSNVWIHPTSTNFVLMELVPAPAQ